MGDGQPNKSLPLFSYSFMYEIDCPFFLLLLLFLILFTRPPSQSGEHEKTK